MTNSFLLRDAYHPIVHGHTTNSFLVREPYSPPKKLCTPPKKLCTPPKQLLSEWTKLLKYSIVYYHIVQLWISSYYAWITSSKIFYFCTRAIVLHIWCYIHKILAAQSIEVFHKKYQSWSCCIAEIRKYLENDIDRNWTYLVKNLVMLWVLEFTLLLPHYLDPS